MRRLTVALDVTPLAGAPTGIHQVTKGLLRSLRHRDDVDVRGWMLSARGRPPDIDIPVRHSRIPAAVAMRGWARANVPPGRFVTGRADVVHGTNFLAPPSAKSVISLQDMTPIAHPEWCEPAVAAMAAPLRNAVRRGATLHVSSELVRREALEALSIPEDRVHLVHHAVTQLEGGDASDGRRLAGGPYVLALGRIEVRKNIGAAIATLDELPTDVRLVIAGPPGNDAATVDAALARHGDRIVRLPQVSDHDRVALTAGAEALLWPSRYEGFALPPLEALAAGTPIVATAVGALPELVGDIVDLVAPGDDEAFTAAVVTALAARAPVSPQTSARVIQHSWDDAAAQMIEIYTRVAAA